MKKIALTGVAFVGLGLLFVWMAGGFVSKLETDSLPSVGEPLNGRELVQVEAQQLPQWQSYSATVVAKQQATLSARITAQVADVLVDVGDEVKAGDILLRLDDQDLDARVRQTQQGLASRQARLNQARSDYRRIVALKESQVVSQAQLDQALSELKSAEADFKGAQASLKEAQTTLGFSLILAPFDGVITHRAVNRGDTASPGIAMLSLYNPETLWLESQIAAGYRNLLQDGQEWPVELPELGLKFMGKVSEITPAADTSSRTVLTRLSVPEQVKEKLYAGLFARLSIQTGTEQWLTIPESARYRIGQLEYVKIVQKDRVAPRLVQTRSEGSTLLVRSGLSAGEKVVLQAN